jgi:hypothetical protein
MKTDLDKPTPTTPEKLPQTGEIEPRFDMTAYTRDQIKDAFLCPINRHSTRVKHKCNDFELYEHPEWLMDHYIKCGGAKEFAKRRDEYTNPCEFLSECRFSTECKLSFTLSGTSNCPLRKMSHHHRTLYNFDHNPNTQTGE